MCICSSVPFSHRCNCLRNQNTDLLLCHPPPSSYSSTSNTSPLPSLPTPSRSLICFHLYKCVCFQSLPALSWWSFKITPETGRTPAEKSRQAWDRGGPRHTEPSLPWIQTTHIPGACVPQTSLHLPVLGLPDHSCPMLPPLL